MFQHQTATEAMDANAARAAGMLTPAPGSTITQSSPVFSISGIEPEGWRIEASVNQQGTLFNVGKFFDSNTYVDSSKNITVLNVPENAVNITLKLSVGSEFNYTESYVSYTASISDIVSTATIVSVVATGKYTSTPPTIEPSIVENGITVESSSPRFTWIDPDQNANTIYDFRVGSTAGSRDLFDLEGNSMYTDLFADTSDLPTDGRKLFLQLFVFRDGPGSTPEIYFSEVTADTIATSGIDRTDMNKLTLPGLISRGDFSETDWENFYGTAGLEEWFTVRPERIAVIDKLGMRALEVEHVPGSGVSGTGTLSVNGGARFTTGNRTSATLAQKMCLRPGFDYASNSQATMKAGFGLRSVEDSSGGEPKLDGFSCRFTTRKAPDNKFYHACYVYAADTTGFGDTYISQVEIVEGQWVDLAMEVVMNTSYGASDGSLRFWVNGQLQSMTKNPHSSNSDVGTKPSNIRWIAQRPDGGPSVPNIEGLAANFFHGGSGHPSWVPGSNQYPAYADIAFKQSTL